MLRTLSSAGKTIIISTHDPNHVFCYCDEVAVLNNHLITFGKPNDVITDSTLIEVYGENQGEIIKHRDLNYLIPNVE